MTLDEEVFHYRAYTRARETQGEDLGIICVIFTDFFLSFLQEHFQGDI